MSPKQKTVSLSWCKVRFVYGECWIFPGVAHVTILFVVFKDRKCSQGEEGVWFGNLRVLVFTDKVALLAFTNHDVRCKLVCSI